MINYRGSIAAMRSSFASMDFGLFIAVILVYLVMVAQFRSFLDPLIVMFAVPMGLIGVIWMLWATGTTLNIESFMGIIYMVGIAVSNAILLVDFANERLRQGDDLRKAVVNSARIRMRPILITALATVVGLLPIALTAEASAPLARAAIGGLAASTVLALVLVPCMYELLYSRRRKRGRTVSVAKLCIVAIVLAMVTLGWACGGPADPMPVPDDPSVEVIRPQRGEMVHSIDLPGDLFGFYEAALHAKVTGYLESIGVDKGDWVKTGQVLAQIQVPELHSNLARAQASLEIAKITYDRLKHVQQSDPRLVSQQDVDMAYAKYQETQAAMQTLRTMVAYTKIVAPFDGVITGRFADPGALIRAGGGDFGVDETSGLISPGATEGAGGHRTGGGPILTLADIDKLRIYIYVPEGSYPLIRLGTPAVLQFDEFPNRVFKGSVARFATSLDLATRTMLTEVDIDNPGHVTLPAELRPRYT